jgi:predicted transcriptional regulator
MNEAITSEKELEEISVELIEIFSQPHEAMSLEELAKRLQRPFRAVEICLERLTKSGRINPIATRFGRPSDRF